MASKEHHKTVISIDDSSLSYLTLQKGAEGFDIVDYGRAELPEGVVVRGEILRADFLTNALRKVQRSVSSSMVDVIIPHEYFLCRDIVLGGAKKGQTTKDRVRESLHHSDGEDWQQNHVCEFSLVPQDGNTDAVLLRCLPQDIFNSYHYVLAQAGFTMQSINSNILAYDHVLPNDRVFLITLQKNHCLVAEFKNGLFTSLKKFQVSYHQFTQDIQKNVGISDTEAQKILKKYGVLRTHKDQRVYKRLIQSMKPLLDYLTKRKTSDQYKMLVTFDGLPVAGFVDVIAQYSQAYSQSFDIISDTRFEFADILSLHRNESYQFSPLIAQALKAWRNDRS